MTTNELKSKIAGYFALDKEHQYYRLVSTRPSRRRPGVFVYWFNRHDHKEVTFVSCDEYEPDLHDLTTLMSYEQ